MHTILPIPVKGTPNLFLPLTKGSLLRLVLANCFSYADDNIFPTMSETFFDKSLILTSAYSSFSNC